VAKSALQVSALQSSALQRYRIQHSSMCAVFSTAAYGWSAKDMAAVLALQLKYCVLSLAFRLCAEDCTQSNVQTTAHGLMCAEDCTQSYVQKLHTDSLIF